MIEIIYRPEADADLESIADYTIEAWGKDQARSYLASLRQAIALLPNFPRRHPEYRSGAGTFHKLVIRQHVVFYQVSDDAIEIARVLHSQMDFEASLTSSNTLG